MKTFFHPEVIPKKGGHPKKKSSWSLREKIVGKVAQNFSGKLGKVRAKIFHPQTFACSYTCGATHATSTALHM